jgi:branched-chain amino acid transport system permease protein
LVRRLFKDFRLSVVPVPGRLIAVIFFVFLFIFPAITSAQYPLLILTLASVYAIFAVAWDLLSGYTGQVNFGFALSFGAGAYGSALLYTYLGWPPPATILIGAVAAALIVVATCFPALRLRGPYLSLLTLAWPILVQQVVLAFRSVTGGYIGLRGLPPLSDSPVGKYYICLAAMTAAVLIMWKLTDGGSKYVRTGLIFHAIREDEIAARATGINTINYKILAFAIGGFFGGLAGGLFGHILGTVGPGGTFSLTLSFQVIIWVIFGGMVSIYGAVAGVFVLYPLVEFLQGTPITQYRTLLMAVIVILILLFMPEGIAVWIRDKIERQCPRCKLSNVAWRKECRACGATLHATH